MIFCEFKFPVKYYYIPTIHLAFFNIEHNLVHKCTFLNLVVNNYLFKTKFITLLLFIKKSSYYSKYCFLFIVYFLQDFKIKEKTIIIKIFGKIITW